MDEIRAKNELALLELEKISLSWSQINTSSEHSDESFDAVLQELVRLRDQVELYSSNR